MHDGNELLDNQGNDNIITKNYKENGQRSRSVKIMYYRVRCEELFHYVHAKINYHTHITIAITKIAHKLYIGFYIFVKFTQD
jgi:hypothetical protein